jgi:predicted deacylase
VLNKPEADQSQPAPQGDRASLSGSAKVHTSGCVASPLLCNPRVRQAYGVEASALGRWPPDNIDEANFTLEAHRAGKVAVGAEWGGGARLDPAGVAAYTQALRCALVALEMLPSTEVGELPLDLRPPITGDYQTTPVGGLFCPAVQLGDGVTAGALLGVIQDEWGETAAEIRAERSGTVAGLPHRPLLRPGDRVAYVG